MLFILNLNKTKRIYKMPEWPKSASGSDADGERAAASQPQRRRWCKKMITTSKRNLKVTRQQGGRTNPLCLRQAEKAAA